MCELDGIPFNCNRCGGSFDHTEGTWLPIGYDYSHQRIERHGNLSIMNSPDSPSFLREPEIVYSDKFTCYGCLTDNDGTGFLEENFEDNAYHLDATNHQNPPLAQAIEHKTNKNNEVD